MPIPQMKQSIKDMVVHTGCSTTPAETGGLLIQEQTRWIAWTYFFKKHLNLKTWGVAQLREYLPGLHDALSLGLVPTAT